jgi:hypothetical protein
MANVVLVSLVAAGTLGFKLTVGRSEGVGPSDLALGAIGMERVEFSLTAFPSDVLRLQYARSTAASTYAPVGRQPSCCSQRKTKSS